MDTELRMSSVEDERLRTETPSSPPGQTEWHRADPAEREALAHRALETDAGCQFSRGFGAHGAPVASMRPSALLRLETTTGSTPTMPTPGSTPTPTRARSSAATASRRSTPGGSSCRSTLSCGDVVAERLQA
jgi:hypothetical protein